MKRIISFVLAIMMCAVLLPAFAACDELGHKHNFGEWKTVVEATCGTKGAKSRVCGCGESETEEIAATQAHELGEDGKCKICSHAHAYGEWQTVVASTCQTSGTASRTCSCGAAETQTLEKIGHSIENGFCTVCGAKNYYVELREDELGTRWAKDEWGTWREYDSIPDELYYNGTTLNFLYWESSSALTPEFVQNEDVDDDVLSAVYKRNKAIEDRLGVKLSFTGELGYSGAVNSFVERVNRSFSAGVSEFDLIASYSRALGLMISQGLVKDLAAINDNYLSIKGIGGRTESTPWWPINLVDTCGINGALYGVTGDISSNAISKMHCIYFNKDLVDVQYEEVAAEYFAQNPHRLTHDQYEMGGGDSASNMLYEMAYGGKWTLDDLIKFSSHTYVDREDNGISEADVYGLCSVNYCMLALYGGSGLRMIVQDPQSTLKIAPDWSGETTKTIISKLSVLLGSDDYYTNTKTGRTYYGPFTRGNAYFVLQYMGFGANFLIGNESAENCGVLPVPKFSTDQRNYYTVLGNESSIYSICSGRVLHGTAAATDTMLTAVLECWASEAYRKTTPAVLENNMSFRYRPTRYEKAMCDIIRSSMMLDLGRVLGRQISGSPERDIQMDGLVMDAALNGTVWEDTVNDNLGSMQAYLAAFVRGLPT